ncbi:hypothetical protein D0817_10775 [Flavobacterium cupreum]|uniref:Uncharacterized protein n=1 Tax=Flavobacterium cupreum TaxID=2133766 RepID=A0A434A7H9_9FLAO|nr:hypothetical protein D0817_10775 [Flavobacterium cupreum]
MFKTRLFLSCGYHFSHRFYRFSQIRALFLKKSFENPSICVVKIESPEELLFKTADFILKNAFKQNFFIQL